MVKTVRVTWTAGQGFPKRVPHFAIQGQDPAQRKCSTRIYSLCARVSSPTFLENIICWRRSDHTCLRIAIQKLGEFCSTLPVVYSVEKLKLQISAVKKRLKVIEMNSKC